MKTKWRDPLGEVYEVDLTEPKAGEKTFRPVTLTLKAKDEKNPDVFTFVITTPDEDRDTDIILPRGVSLKHYKKNPVVLWAHNYWDPPIGRTVRIEVSDAGIEADVLFADTPLAQEIRMLVETGFLRAASIGFIPKEFEPRDPEKPWRSFTFKKVEMLEWSIVSVPSNPMALAASIKSKGLKTEAIEAAIAEMAAKAAPEGNHVEKDVVSPPVDAAADPESGNKPGVPVKVFLETVAPQVVRLDSALLIDKMTTQLAERDEKIAELEAQVRNHGQAGPLPKVRLHMHYSGSWIEIDGKRLEGVTHVEASVSASSAEGGSRVPKLLIHMIPSEVKISGVAEHEIEKIGAVLNRKNKERLQQARDAVQEVLDSAEPQEEEDEGKAALIEAAVADIRSDGPLAKLLRQLAWKAGDHLVVSPTQPEPAPVPETKAVLRLKDAPTPKAPETPTKPTVKLPDQASLARLIANAVDQAVARVQGKVR